MVAHARTHQVFLFLALALAVARVNLHWNCSPYLNYTTYRLPNVDVHILDDALQTPVFRSLLLVVGEDGALCRHCFIVRGLLQVCRGPKTAQFCARRGEKRLSQKWVKLRKIMKTSNNDENFKKRRFPTHYLASKTSKNTENFGKY
jgi:hypothetical protein